MKFETHLEQVILRILKFAVSYNNCEISIRNPWWKIYSLTSQFDLINCLQKLKEYWNFIAPQQSIKTPIKQLDWLISFFSYHHQSSSTVILNWNDINKFLKYCMEVINILPYEYSVITDVFLNDLVIARKLLYQKLKCISNTHDESCISLLNNLKLSNDNNNIDNILNNISKGVDTFCSYIYKENGFKRITSENELIFSKTMCSYKTIEDYCNKLSNIIKIMLKINKLKIEQILESDIIINEFLKAILNFDNNLETLNKESLIEYCLMKNKNSFIKTLIYFQNNLAAIKNLICTIKI